MSNGHSCGPHYKRLVTAFAGSALVLLMTAAASYNEAAVTVSNILSAQVIEVPSHQDRVTHRAAAALEHSMNNHQGAPERHQVSTNGNTAAHDNVGVRTRQGTGEYHRNANAGNNGRSQVRGAGGVQRR